MVKHRLAKLNIVRGHDRCAGFVVRADLSPVQQSDDTKKKGQNREGFHRPTPKGKDGNPIRLLCSRMSS